MNCFQKLLSSWHDTTLCWISQLLFVLWIAFKNYYLRDTTQPTHPVILELNCCELLSKIIIFVTRHNSNNFRRILCLVVNCFQKLLSSWHDTTSSNWVIKVIKLWIAFKNYYLRDTTQHFFIARSSPLCCELLSKIIIFVTRHNRGFIGANTYLVVNCFQKLLSSWHDTTTSPSSSFLPMLWIAFKNYYLRDTTQRSLH